MNALAARLADRIRRAGPIGVDAFMAAALGDPEHGYYTTRDPLGAAGDFTTAPEISQIFGEVIGFWCAHLWQAMGRPDPVLLVELGPGRGTLTADLLRALAVLPGCRAAVRVHLVETSPALRAAQKATLGRRHPGLGITWHDTAETLPAGPMLLVANEFFDALPIRQWVRRGAGWAERRVGLDAEGGFAFMETTEIEILDAPDGPEGAIFEAAPASLAVAETLGRRLAAAPGAALIVDYGHGRTACGETLQAVRAHRPAPVLAEPGLADLTAHVDFEALAEAFRRAGAPCHGPVTQRGFLLANGAGLRAERLMQGKDETIRAAVAAGFQRLVDPAQMGLLFKVLAATSPGLAAPPGFEPLEDSMITLPLLSELPGIRHGFFTRAGGVSEGLHAGLNCGFGSQDDPARVAENRARAMARLGLGPDALVTVHQVHSPDAVAVTQPWPHPQAPKADALVTDRPGIALGILTADCVPVLFADAENHVIGAAHAGWKGALGGVLDATVAAMIRLGATRIRAAIGPAIQQTSYEVGPEFPERFIAEDPANARFAVPAPRPGHFLFDLPAYVEARLGRLGVAAVERSPLDTRDGETQFFSFRRATLRGEPDYGRGLSAIALAP